MDENVELQQACVASAAEIKAIKRRCWRPGCKRKAFIRDWKGWKWCLPCWWRQIDGHWLIELRYLRFF